jgi:predicted ester cyclase
MYRAFVRFPAKYNFDIFECLSDVMDTQLTAAPVDGSFPPDELVDMGVKADSLAFVEALKGWMDRVPDRSFDIELIVGEKIVSLRQNTLSSAKEAMQRASGG